MRCIFVVNDTSALEAGQTTKLLARKALGRGHETYFTQPDWLSVDVDNQVVAEVVPAQNPATDALPIALGAGDLLAVRTNPARGGPGPIHAIGLDLLTLAQRSGAAVVNDPSGLRRATSKLYLNTLPARLRPGTVVSRDAKRLRRFVESKDTFTILKPLSGTRGMDVFKVRAGDPNLNQIIDIMTRWGPTLAQEFVPEAAAGDIRILVLDGRPLEVGGAVAAVRRVPTGTDFRSNVHVGAVPEPVDLDERLRSLVATAAPHLRADGLTLCGLDVIGDKIVEVNVFSAGGLVDANAFYGVDFTAPILDHFERVAARRVAGDAQARAV